MNPDCLFHMAWLLTNSSVRLQQMKLNQMASWRSHSVKRNRFLRRWTLIRFQWLGNKPQNYFARWACEQFERLVRSQFRTYRTCWGKMELSYGVVQMVLMKHR